MLRTTLSFVFTFSLVVTLTACQSGAGESPDPEPVLIAVVELDSYSAFPSPTQIGPMLEAGEPYRITVEGTYSVWDLSTTTVELCKGDDESSPMFPSPGRVNGPVLLDARYQFAVLSWDPACDAETDTPFVSGGFRVSLDGGATFVILVPEGANGFDPGHLYTYDVTGVGEAVRFQIADSVASDNYGVLKIEVHGFE
jgi:hypothetical protein